MRLRERVAERFGLRDSALSDQRVDAALALLGAAQLDALPSLPDGAPAWQHALDQLVVGETNFFRQRPWFARLEEVVLAPLIADRMRTGCRRLRIWSAGCATGEEPYSLALVLRRLLQGLGEWDVRIVGTDVSSAFLAAARRAVYRPWALREVDPELRARAFHSVDRGCFELAPAMRANVSFAVHNLAADVPLPPALALGDVDLAVCRNVLMYLEPEQQRAVARRLARTLAPGGWLAVAPIEANREWFPELTLVNAPSAIFFHREEAA